MQPSVLKCLPRHTYSTLRAALLLHAQVALSGLDVYAHNLETVESLQRRVRDHRAGYAQVHTCSLHHINMHLSTVFIMMQQRRCIQKHNRCLFSTACFCSPSA
jgi:hypothetical protein